MVTSGNTAYVCVCVEKSICTKCTMYMHTCTNTLHCLPCSDYSTNACLLHTWNMLKSEQLQSTSTDKILHTMRCVAMHIALNTIQFSYRHWLALFINIRCTNSIKCSESTSTHSHAMRTRLSWIFLCLWSLGTRLCAPTASKPTSSPRQYRCYVLRAQKYIQPQHSTYPVRK